jgi:hypothetical protein
MGARGSTYGQVQIEAKIALKSNMLGAIFRFTFKRFSGIISDVHNST